jgi:hypothetical protein
MQVLTVLCVYVWHCTVLLEQEGYWKEVYLMYKIEVLLLSQVHWQQQTSDFLCTVIKNALMIKPCTFFT